MPNVAFKDDVWPKFLRENATRVLKLDEYVAGNGAQHEGRRWNYSPASWIRATCQ